MILCNRPVQYSCRHRVTAVTCRREATASTSKSNRQQQQQRTRYPVGQALLLSSNNPILLLHSARPTSATTTAAVSYFHSRSFATSTVAATTVFNSVDDFNCSKTAFSSSSFIAGKSNKLYGNSNSRNNNTTTTYLECWYTNTTNSSVLAPVPRLDTSEMVLGITDEEMCDDEDGR